MSQAFMREREEEWLGNVEPNVPALLRYLTRENSGIPVEEKRRYQHPREKREVYEMTNGSTYALDMDRRWYVLPD